MPNATLREIAARVSAILDPADVLERIVVESARILGSDGARIDLWDEEMGALRWAYAVRRGDVRRPGLGPDRRAQAAPGGRRPGLCRTGPGHDPGLPRRRALRDDTGDRGLRPRAPASARSSRRRWSASRGRSGVLSVVSREPGAYSDEDVENVSALATQASIAIRNANLMDQLARSRTDIQRRAEAEQALREIGASLAEMREPGDVLQRVADESVRLLRADGAVIDQFDPENETLRWAYDSGISEAQREGVKLTNLPARRGRLRQGRRRGPGHHRRRLHGRRVPARRAGRLARQRRRPARPHRRPDHR